MSLQNRYTLSEKVVTVNSLHFCYSNVTLVTLITDQTRN